ncbi:hypothetical protein NLG97_g8459 [Lecanicillium saksenae]|uniref:Uncharacterized protein n=1 Tax=Lecanicillium saksenae TaxID=468837 RepID=A0ACC1QLW8_9HYPO|nr:hypothetical protein NLG97_g8459 [Lecanicillium saksenae]
MAASGSPPGVRRKPVAAFHRQLPADDAVASLKPLILVDTADADESGLIRTNKKRANVFSLWKWEFISLLMSILSFTAIVVILLVYQNRLLSEWKLPISINAIVAIFSALFKGSLAMPVTEGISQLKWLWFARQPRNLVDMEVYDKASRGVWGAVLMIFKRGPKSFLASFGAILAIITLAVDPFSQASVTSKPCWRAVDDKATIPRANNYAAFGFHTGAGGTGVSIDPAMNLAAYMGVLKPPVNTSVSIPVSCRTNNCTFPSDNNATFLSLGLRVLSWDISDQVVDLKSQHGGWNYTLSWGININQNNKLLGATSTVAPGTSFLPDGEGPWNRTSLVDVQLLGMKFQNESCNYTVCEIHGGDVKPAAYMFSLLPCVQTFAANFTNGVYTEKLLDEQDLHFPLPLVGYQLAVNRTIYNGKWQDCKGEDQRTDTNTVAVYSPAAQTYEGAGTYVTRESLPVEAWYRPECVYSIGSGAYRAIGNLIGPVGFFDKRQILQDDMIGGLLGEAWMQTLWNQGTMSLDHVTDFAQGVARSISAQMRLNPSDEGDAMRVAVGVMWQTETCVIFEWKWLLFLAGLLVLEIIFFITVVLVNYKGHWGADWKSSTLAVAYQNLGSVTNKEAKVPDPELEEHLRDAAKSTKVLFTDVGGKWQLCKVEES